MSFLNRFVRGAPRTAHWPASCANLEYLLEFQAELWVAAVQLRNRGLLGRARRANALCGP